MQDSEIKIDEIKMINVSQLKTMTHFPKCDKEKQRNKSDHFRSTTLQITFPETVNMK